MEAYLYTMQVLGLEYKLICTIVDNISAISAYLL